LPHLLLTEVDYSIVITV